MNATLLAIHYAIFFVALGLARLSERAFSSLVVPVLGVVAVPVFALLTLALLDFSDHAGNGTTGAWYLIFSIVTLGGVPVVTLTSAAISGLCLDRTQRWWRNRKSRRERHAMG